MPSSSLQRQLHLTLGSKLDCYSTRGTVGCSLDYKAFYGARVIGLTSPGMVRIPFLREFLGADARLIGRAGSPTDVDAVARWGIKSTGQKAQLLAQRFNVPVLHVEDGFLRSFGTGDRYPPLALVVDEVGIYYDSTCASALENLLDSETDVLADLADKVARAKALIVAHGLSKYNHAPSVRQLSVNPLRNRDTRRVLVVDQTAGDMSVALGGACADTFAAMLEAAHVENPGATFYVKTHPEVSAGRKGGYLTHVQDDERTVVLRQAINSLSLIEQMDRVYVVTSTMGFEALLIGKPVSVFGLPWYEGWGITDDRQSCPRRTRQRSVDELFAAAYFHYARYLNPVTRQRGTIFDVIDWLVSQRETVERLPRRFVAVGFRRWKAAHLRPMLSMARDGVTFVKDAAGARELGLRNGDGLIHWGRDAPEGLEALAAENGLRLCHLEDGFYRSVGLGSDLIRPQSLVIDEQGLYLDPRGPSDLERLLNTAAFPAEELARARSVRELIIEHGLTKYNIEVRQPVDWPSKGRTVVLVPGQVEDDASVLHGCMSVRSNLGLLQAVRTACPEAFIVFKPHPDVASGNRRGRVPLAEALRYADWVEPRASVVSCIEAADAVHTLTSMAGFEALLRGKSVVVYGRPFYAGWGLTEDQLGLPRRTRRLSLDELVAGALLRYPLYWDWELKGFTTCEAVLRRLVEERDALVASGRLSRLKSGWWRRQLRKARALMSGLQGA